MDHFILAVVQRNQRCTCFYAQIQFLRSLALRDAAVLLRFSTSPAGNRKPSMHVIGGKIKKTFFRMPTNILLGPELDLHRGVHYSLAKHPPAGCEYTISDARHTFLFPGEAGSPFERPHWGEFVSFGPGTGLVHTPRWPALDRKAWITDTDDFGYPVFSGRHALSPAFRESFRRPWTADLRKNILCRAENMLSAYAHPSCKTVFFRSRFALDRTRAWIADLGLGCVTANAFLAKTAVLYPAQQPCPAEVVRKKWSLPQPMRVLFIGRDFETKNGRIALQAFDAAARSSAAHFTYIGNIPPEAVRENTALFEHIEYYPSLPRDEVLAKLMRSHVLFHPSKFEGFGTVLMEAASMALAVVVACGVGMAHIHEIFDDSGALIVDRTRVSTWDEPDVFASHLRRLLDDPRLARSLGLGNYELTQTGRFSMAVRSATLSAAYERALSAPAEPPLRIGDLPYSNRCTEAIMTTRAVEAEEESFRMRHGITQRRFTV